MKSKKLIRIEDFISSGCTTVKQSQVQIYLQIVRMPKPLAHFSKPLAPKGHGTLCFCSAKAVRSYKFCFSKNPFAPKGHGLQIFLQIEDLYLHRHGTRLRSYKFCFSKTFGQPKGTCKYKSTICKKLMAFGQRTCTCKKIYVYHALVRRAKKWRVNLNERNSTLTNLLAKRTLCFCKAKAVRLFSFALVRPKVAWVLFGPLWGYYHALRAKSSTRVRFTTASVVNKICTCKAQVIPNRCKANTKQSFAFAAGDPFGQGRTNLNKRTAFVRAKSSSPLPQRGKGLSFALVRAKSSSAHRGLSFALAKPKPKQKQRVRFVYKQIGDSHADGKRKKTKFKFVRKIILKSFQVKKHVVTFRKLVPKALFRIQNMQNPCKTHYTIVRPLINCSRHTITMACILNRLPVYPDISNKKVRYSRNRIRKQVIPSLQFFFNPEVEKALFNFSERSTHL